MWTYTTERTKVELIKRQIALRAAAAKAAAAPVEVDVGIDHPPSCGSAEGTSTAAFPAASTVALEAPPIVATAPTVALDVDVPIAAIVPPAASSDIAPTPAAA